jgi:hypothetical protein
MTQDPGTEARAFWTTGPGIGEIRSHTLPDPGPGERRLHTLASAISRGSEALVFAGRVPPSQYAVMRAPFMAGEFPAPVKYGYSAVAEDTDGARYFVLHPHQDRFNAPDAACIRVPDNVPTPRATLTANMETALNIVWDAAPLAGERILVIGGGVVGLLTAALLANIPATTVTVADTNPARIRQAQALGCHFTLPKDAPAEQELIVHTSTTEQGIRLALSRAAFEARIIEASWFGIAAPAVPLGEAFHSRRLRLIASQVGAVSPAMRGRRSHAQRLAMALDLLADPAFEILLEGPTRFEELPHRMGAILSAGGLCHILRYD